MLYVQFAMDSCLGRKFNLILCFYLSGVILLSVMFVPEGSVHFKMSANLETLALSSFANCRSLVVGGSACYSWKVGCIGQLQSPVHGFNRSISHLLAQCWTCSLLDDGPHRQCCVTFHQTTGLFFSMAVDINRTNSYDALTFTGILPSAPSTNIYGSTGAFCRNSWIFSSGNTRQKHA